MNTIQFGIFEGFTPPATDRLFSRQLIDQWVNNIFTLGIDAATRGVEHRYRLCELEKEQVLLLKKSAHLEKGWKTLEHHLCELIEKVIGDKLESDDVEAEIGELEERIQELLLEKDQLEEFPVVVEEESFFQRLTRTTLTIFIVLGQLSRDLSSLGFQSCYENYLLNNRIKVLNAQNQFLKTQTSGHKEEYDNFFEKNIELLRSGMESKRNLAGIQHTDSAKAYFEIQEKKKELQKLQDQQKDLQKEFNQLEVQYKAVKEAEKKLVALNQSYDQLCQRHEDLNKQRTQQLKAKQDEMDALRRHIEQLNRQSNRVQTLDQGLGDLQKRIGFISPKYAPQGAELEALVKEAKDNDFPDAFAKLYGGITMAPEAFRKGFAQSLSEIFDMAEKTDKDKIKLNRSLGTPTSKGSQIVYRHLALDWIKHGKIIATCHGHELHLNEEDLKLVPSVPENVLKYRDIDGKRQPAITVHFQERDDFTPSESELNHTSAARGIDPVAAKCLWVTLDTEEQKHFLNLLFEPAMEDDHPDYVAALDFISKLPKKKQELMYTLRDLISDIGVCLETKFRQSMAMGEWQNYLDVENDDLQPFVKAEKEDSNVPAHIKDVEEEEGPLIPWELHFDILVNGYDEEGEPLQGEFFELVSNAQERYQTYFRNLTPDLLQNPLAPDKKISVQWNHLTKQYYKTHQLIDNHGCLLSNLLAVIMVDAKDLTGKNVRMLKMAMAAYLDDPGHAKEYKGAIKNDFKCSIEEFQDWLRGESTRFDYVDLTTTVLEIAAYTLGVRIALFSPPSHSGDFANTKGKVDGYGRLLPIENIMGHYFGPPTEEVFCMSVKDDYTYYGLFPKLKVKGVDPKKLGIDSDTFAIFQELNDYWLSIEEHLS